jgi:ABC-type branched-subunit amino acid transport system substrate-binding protein
MRFFRILSLSLAIVLLLGLRFSTFCFAGPLTPEERRGKQIYLKTISPSGEEIKAFVGIASVEAPGAVMACVNCHGSDGRGRPESGIQPSNITWKELTKPYGVKHSSGREHPAYTEMTVARAITKGLDPAGNRLDPAMPVYTMPADDLKALIAYLKRLETDLDPGLTERSIRIGTVLPSEGPAGEIGRAIQRTIQAYFDDINEKGGIYNRKLELVSKEPQGKKPLEKEEVIQFLQQKDLFALVSTFTPGLDKEIPSLAEMESIPIVGPFTLFPNTEFSLNRHLFYIFSGLAEQARALVDYGALHFNIKNAQVAILHPAREDLGEIIRAVEEQCKKRGWEKPLRIEYPLKKFDEKERVRQLKEKNIDLILSLGIESETIALMKEADHINWTPAFMLFGVLMGKGISDIPSGFKNKVYLAYPTLPEDRKEKGWRDLSLLLKKHNLSTPHLMAQISTYVALQILTEGLRRSGRDLSRERFISALEKLYEFETGLTPPITYGPNKRIGALGAYVVRIDPEKDGQGRIISSKKWVTPN